MNIPNPKLGMTTNLISKLIPLQTYIKEITQKLREEGKGL